MKQKKKKLPAKKEKAKPDLAALLFPEKLSPEAVLSLKEEIKIVVEKFPADLTGTRKYKPTMCFKILDGFLNGKDKETIATEIGVTIRMFNRWRKKYKQFDFAVRIGEQLCKRWWLEIGRKNIYNKNFNHVLWMMNMSNRYKWLTSMSKEEKKIEKTDKKIVEFKFEDSRIADIIRQAENNRTIVEAGSITEDQSEIYQD